MTTKRKPRTWTADAFAIRSSTIPLGGKGLFAAEDIREEDTIGYYTGEIITGDELEDGVYAESPYILWVANNHVIVGEGPRSNYTRYINHSKRPNAFLVVSTRWKTARFEAIKRIRPGEEIFFDYGEDYWNNMDFSPKKPRR